MQKPELGDRSSQGALVTTEKSSFRRVLANRSIFALWLTQTVSQMGDYAFNVALLWYVLESTRSILLVGVTQAVVATPVVIIGPLAGVYVDRFNRRNVMLASAIFQGVVVGAFALLFATANLDFYVLLSLVFALFSGQQFFTSAMNAYIPRAVEPRDLGAANSLFSLSSVSNMLLGYAVGGLVLSILGVSVIVLYDCATFFAAAGLLLACSGSFGRSRAEQKGDILSEYPSKSFVGDFKDGLSFIRSSPLLLELMVVGTILTFFADGLIALLPSYVSLQLDGNATTYGLVLAAAVVGGAVGSVIYGKITSRNYLGKMFIFCVSMSGLAILILGLNTGIVVAFLAASLMGGAYFVANLCVQVLVQARVPGVLLGRVYTVFFGVLSLFAPIGAVISGVFAGYSNPGIVYTIYGASVFSVGVVALLVMGKLKRAHY